MSMTYRTCSCCGQRFETEAEFLDKTVMIGVIETRNYMMDDLELRNCLNCCSTLARKVPKDIVHLAKAG